MAQHSWVIILTVMVGGCYNQVLVSPDFLGTSTTQDIVVSTRDGRRVSFSGGSYRIADDTTGRRVLEGNGRIQPRVSAQDEPFTGQIPLDEIDSIHSPERSALFYVSVVAGAAGAALFVIVLMVHGRGNLGG